jgi:hypothetical protein
MIINAGADPSDGRLWAYQTLYHGSHAGGFGGVQQQRRRVGRPLIHTASKTGRSRRHCRILTLSQYNREREPSSTPRSKAEWKVRGIATSDIFANDR